MANEGIQNFDFYAVKNKYKEELGNPKMNTTNTEIFSNASWKAYLAERQPNTKVAVHNSE